MDFAMFATGFATGAFLMALMGVLVALVAAACAWRFARAVEKTGIDIQLKPEKLE
jgi:hypothetical protein